MPQSRVTGLYLPSGLSFILYAVSVLVLLSFGAHAQLCTDVSLVVDTTSFEFPLKQVELLHQVNQTQAALALTMDGYVFYSSDGGRDWTDITTELSNYWKPNSVGQTGIARFIACPNSSRGRVYFLGFSTYYWTLEVSNSGEPIINSYSSTSPLLNLIPSTTDDDRALMNAVPLGCDLDFSSSSCRSVLFETSNFGQLWNTVADNVHQYAWSDAGDTVFFLATNAADEASGGSFYWYTPVTNELEEIVGKGAVEFAYEDGVLFLVVVADVSGSLENPGFRYQLKVSEDNGHSFVNAVFSAGSAATADQNTAGEFVLANVGFGTTFINVERTDIRWGSLYVGRTESASFYVTLQFNLLNNGVADFTSIRLQAESGIFIANMYDVTPLASLNDYSSIIRTMATFDKGGVWHTIPSPINCTTECSLHLRGPTDVGQPQIVSTSSAAGLVLGSGNIGLYRSSAVHDSVFFSRSAGYSWEKVLDSPHKYTIADHGALLLALPSSEPTGTLRYTWDQGLTWSSCVLTQNLIDVERIITVGGSTSTTFLIVGSYYDGIRSKGVVQYIDFAVDALPRECVGVDAPDTPESDFETWTAAVNGKCLMGKTSTYVRRKRGAECFVSDAFDAYDASLEEICPCTREDYMCDGACYRKTSNGTCEYVCTDVESTEQECTDGFRMESQGYIKVPGDVCEGGVDLGPQQVSCEDDEESPYWQTVMAMWLTASCFAMIGLVLVLAAVLLLARSNARVRAIIDPVLPLWCTTDTGLCCGGRDDVDDDEDGYYAQLSGNRSAGSLVDDDDDDDMASF